ncbi:MAG: roadblock/LC7 domain-containing protein [Crocosphaera sp.]|nr:roadblock/LC7 domain-containing protein [Crocosphaera sp.]
MYLAIEQLIYTSFDHLGFKCLVSPLISADIEKNFINHVVEKYWNHYNPPESKARRAYLKQISPEQTFFGWLYNDGCDDLGRDNVPYFICYFLPGKLNLSSLTFIWKCLAVGPVMDIERQTPPESLDSVIISKTCHYQPSRLGVHITQNIQTKSYQNLQQGKLINKLVVNTKKRTTSHPYPLEEQNLYLSLTTLPLTIQRNQITIMNLSTIEPILQDLAMKAIGIQGIALVSQEGQPLSVPIGFDKDTTSIIAGTMLYLAQTTENELNWQNVEMISLRSQDGHLILACCNTDTYLLVKAGKVLTGLLEAEISRTVKKIRETLQSRDSSASNPLSYAKLLDEGLSLNYKQLEGLEEESPVSIDHNLPSVGTVAPLQKDLERQLIEIAQDLINLYPDFIAKVRDIDNQPDMNAQSMQKLGQYVGAGLITRGKIKQVSPKNIMACINKLILPAISDFTIADSHKNEIKVYANPFCIHKTSTKPSCYFLRGMMEGLIQSVNTLPELMVDETTCKATGADCCTFVIR